MHVECAGAVRPISREKTTNFSDTDHMKEIHIRSKISIAILPVLGAISPSHDSCDERDFFWYIIDWCTWTGLIVHDHNESFNLFEVLRIAVDDSKGVCCYITKHCCNFLECIPGLPSWLFPFSPERIGCVTASESVKHWTSSALAITQPSVNAIDVIEATVFSHAKTNPYLHLQTFKKELVVFS